MELQAIVIYTPDGKEQHGFFMDTSKKTERQKVIEVLEVAAVVATIIAGGITAYSFLRKHLNK